MSETITVNISRITAKALLCAMAGQGRNILGDFVALRVAGCEARWESTDGDMLLLIRPEFGFADPEDVEDGVYLLDRRTLERRAIIPARLWSEEDGRVDMKRGTNEWPNVDAVVGRPTMGCDAGRVLLGAPMDTVARIKRTVRIRTWSVEVSGGIGVTRWHAIGIPYSAEIAALEVYVMPVRGDGESDDPILLPSERK